MACAFWSAVVETRNVETRLLCMITKQWLRRRIETLFGEITKLFPKKIHATTLLGFILKISLFMFAYHLETAFIQ